jgi:ATP-dependent DNA helicase RecQ
MTTGLMTLDELQEAISRYWGYTTFRPLQRDAMDAVLAGRDSIVVLPTGAGKSLCFQAPAVVHPGVALVVSPLISLMKDQVDTLVGNGVAAAVFNSTLTPGEKTDVVAGLRQGRYKLLYVSPERLVGEGSEQFLALLSSLQVSFVAIDEAHCISQWGHDFRPEYRQLGRLRQLLPGIRLHAYTATANAPGAARHRDAAGSRESGGVRRVVRSAEPDLPDAAPRHAQEAARRRPFAAQR